MLKIKNRLHRKLTSKLSKQKLVPLIRIKGMTWSEKMEPSLILSSYCIILLVGVSMRILFYIVFNETNIGVVQSFTESLI